MHLTDTVYVLCANKSVNVTLTAVLLNLTKVRKQANLQELNVLNTVGMYVFIGININFMLINTFMQLIKGFGMGIILQLQRFCN